MNDFLKSGIVGSIELDEQRKIREAVENRWESIGFLEGLQGAMKENMATLFENTAKSLKKMNEATDAHNSGAFETVVFPIVRRVFGKLLANDIVSVQAMNLPIGRLYYIMPVTSEREWMDANGNLIEGGDYNPEGGETGSHKGLMGYTRMNRNYDAANSGNMFTNRFYLPDETICDMNTDDAVTYSDNPRELKPQVVQYMRKTLYDLFYNDFLFDNSKGKVTIKAGTTQNVVLLPNGAIVNNNDINKYMHTDGTVRNIMMKVQGFTTFNNGKLTGPDGNEMDTEEFLASLKVVAVPAATGDTYAIAPASGDNGYTSAFKAYESIPFRVVTQQYGKAIANMNYIENKGELLIELNLAKPVTTSQQTIDGYIGVDKDAISSATFRVLWAQYDSLELETEIGEVSFRMDHVTVSVTERKLRATWSPELSQDVAAFHNIDAEAELTSILSEQVGAEIDREILRDLRKVAPWQLDWDYNGWRRMGGFSTNYTQKDWNQMLMTKINQISAQVQKSTLRGGVNFIVVSSEINAVLNDLEYFHVTDASAEQDMYNMGIERVGSLQGRYQVYVDPYAPSWSMILGHKGKSLLDTGYIYAPYVPLSLTPTMYNPMNFAPVKGILTRYAKKCVNNRFFGGIRVNGLTTWSTNELR